MSTFIAELVAFVIIIAILIRYVLPIVKAGLAKQQEQISEQVAEAEDAKKRLAEAERAHQNAVHEARIEAAQIRENARAEAQRTVEELSTTAQQESARIIARGDEQLATQRATVVRELRGEIGSLAVELSEQIVDRHLAQEREVSASVDAFLAELEAGNTGGASSATRGGTTS